MALEFQDHEIIVDRMSSYSLIGVTLLITAEEAVVNLNEVLSNDPVNLWIEVIFFIWRSTYFVADLTIRPILGGELPRLEI